jgi:hypothetical protein
MVVEPEPGRRPVPLIGSLLVVSGAAMLIGGVAVAIAIGEPAALIIALVGAVDLALGFAFRSGRIGAFAHRPSPPGAREDMAAGGVSGDPTASDPPSDGELDPSYNPYARED